MTALHDKVFYYPAATETGILPDLDEQPFVAIVCHVHAAPDVPAKTPAKDRPPQLVNLAIFDHRGITHGRQDVPVLPDGKGQRPCCTTTYTKPKETKKPAEAEAEHESEAAPA
jgi:hypothetical protein